MRFFIGWILTPFVFLGALIFQLWITSFIEAPVESRLLATLYVVLMLSISYTITKIYSKWLKRKEEQSHLLHQANFILAIASFKDIKRILDDMDDDSML